MRCSVRNTTAACVQYCNSLFYGIADGQLQRLQSVQRAAAWLPALVALNTSRRVADPQVASLAAGATVRHVQTGYARPQMLDCQSRAGLPRWRLSAGLSPSNKIGHCGVPRATKVDLFRQQKVRRRRSAYVEQPSLPHPRSIAVLRGIFTLAEVKTHFFG